MGKGRTARERTPLTPAQQALAADPHSLTLAEVAAKRFARGRGGLYDDLRSAALHGLVEAAGRYDPTRGVKFSTYAQHVIRSFLLDFCRELGRGRGRHGPPAREVVPLASVASGEGPVGWEEESLDSVRGMIRHLHDSHRETLWLLFACAGTATQALAAVALGVGEARVCQRRTAALATLREVLRHG